MTYEARLAQTAVDLGSDPDFTPLDPLFSASRIVMLGEQDHGDGASFAFKSRLIEYLHQHCGYNVLAFESDFYGLARAWQEAREPSAIRAHVVKQVYSIWSQAEETSPLWTLIEKRFESSRPLVVAGIDPRHILYFPLSSVLAELDGLLAQTEVKHEDYATFRALLTGLLEHEYDHKISPAEQASFFRVLAHFQKAFGDAPQGSAWPREHYNLEFTARNAWGLGGRDQGMASNLVWLAQKRYPHEKIIVWAHNFHIAKNTSLIINSDPWDFNDTLLGEGATKSLEGVCSLGFISAEGWSYMDTGDGRRRTELDTPPPGSLEAQLQKLGHEHAFIDLRAFPTKPFTMNGVTHYTSSEQRWAEAYDGVFYIRTMHGPTY